LSLLCQSDQDVRSCLINASSKSILGAKWKSFQERDIDHGNRIPVCPDKGSCQQRVMSRCRVGHRRIRKFGCCLRHQDRWSGTKFPEQARFRPPVVRWNDVVLDFVQQRDGESAHSRSLPAPFPGDGQRSSYAPTNVRLRGRTLAWFLQLGLS
jgi:hypothetical protein